MNIVELKQQYPDSAITTLYFTPPFEDNPIELYCLIPTIDQYNEIIKDNDYIKLVQECVKNTEINELVDTFPASTIQIGKTLLESCRVIYEEEEKVILNKLKRYKDSVGDIGVGLNALINNDNSPDKKAFILYCSQTLFLINSFLTGGGKK
jgi:hypothetical protein